MTESPELRAAELVIQLAKKHQVVTEGETDYRAAVTLLGALAAYVNTHWRDRDV